MLFLSGVLLYSILVEPRLQKTKICLVLTKMDYAYRQMRNEALLMLQIEKLKTQVPQDITIIEASAITKEGLDQITEWLFNWVFLSSSSTKQWKKLLFSSFQFLCSLCWLSLCFVGFMCICMGEQKKMIIKHPTVVHCRGWIEVKPGIKFMSLDTLSPEI